MCVMPFAFVVVAVLAAAVAAVVLAVPLPGSCDFQGF